MEFREKSRAGSNGTYGPTGLQSNTLNVNPKQSETSIALDNLVDAIDRALALLNDLSDKLVPIIHPEEEREKIIENPPQFGTLHANEIDQQVKRMQDLHYDIRSLINRIEL